MRHVSLLLKVLQPQKGGNALQRQRTTSRAASRVSAIVRKKFKQKIRTSGSHYVRWTCIFYEYRVQTRNLFARSLFQFLLGLKKAQTFCSSSRNLENGTDQVPVDSAVFSPKWITLFMSVFVNSSLACQESTTVNRRGCCKFHTSATHIYPHWELLTDDGQDRFSQHKQPVSDVCSAL